MGGKAMRNGDMAMDMMLWGDEPKEKRKSIPKKLLRQAVWKRDKGICRVCGRRVDKNDWALGHNRARSKGGKLTFKNTYVVHPSCNRSQHTLTLKETRRFIGSPETDQEKARRLLNSLTADQLKRLADKHGIKLRGKVVDSFLWRETLPPSKRQYVNALAKALTSRQVKVGLGKMS
jgi:hypothetical protein